MTKRLLGVAALAFSLCAAATVHARASTDTKNHQANQISRHCLQAETAALLDRLETKFGPVHLVSTCRPGARMTFDRARLSWHSSGRAFDFEVPNGRRKGEIMEWLGQNSPGVTMSYRTMGHIHADTGDFHKVIYNAANAQAGERAVAIWKARAAGDAVLALIAPAPVKPAVRPAALASTDLDVILALDEARSYLVRTASPGYTMTRDGVEANISKLHPVFAVRLAGAIAEARRSGLPDAGCASAFRPPAFGVGGYANKFDSNHAYGLACDMAGIGAPGSDKAGRWNKIAAAHGLYNPYYGTRAWWEWNHYQPMDDLKAVAVLPALRKTITAKGPIEALRMWALGDRILARSGPHEVRIAALRPLIRRAHARRYAAHHSARVRHASL